MSNDTIDVVGDRSGSMKGLVAAMVTAHNTFLTRMQGDPRGREATYRFTTFDSLGFDEVLRGITKNVKPLQNDQYVPRALTPLFDAIGFAIEEISKSSPGGRHMLAIITDGLNNASRRYTKESLRSLIEQKRAEGWIILFLGANFDAWHVASEIGIPNEYAMNFRASDAGLPRPGFFSRLFGSVREHPMTYALGAAAAVGLAAWALSPSEAHARGVGFTEDMRNGSMGVTEGWQTEVQEDIQAFDESYNDVFDLPPDVAALAATLPDDFNPALGSIDEDGNQPGLMSNQADDWGTSAPSPAPFATSTRDDAANWGDTADSDDGDADGSDGDDSDSSTDSSGGDDD